MTKQLSRLHELVHLAKDQVDLPWRPGETSRPITFFTDHLDDEGWRLGWVLVGALRDRHAELFGLYGEESLHRAALDLIVAADQPPSLTEIADALRESAGADSSWLVAIPLANIEMGRPWIPLSDTAVLLRSPRDDDDLNDATRDAAESERVEADSAVFRHLGDRLPPASRFIRLPDRTKIDTGRSATIVSVERGPAQMATETARAKAHYAISTWSLLAPPVRWHLLPDLGVWWSQPDTHQRVRHKRLETNRWSPKESRRGGDIRHWAPFELPDETTLASPFEAFDRLDRRSAQALLSGTSAHYAAGRASRAPLSERIRDVQAALECLCEPAPGAGRARARWKSLAERFKVWDRVSAARAYTPESLRDLQQRLVNARNISAHGADAALIDLGWGDVDRRLKFGEARATDLAISALHRDLGAMLFAVGEALRGAWLAMLESDFDDDAFEQLFVAS